MRMRLPSCGRALPAVYGDSAYRRDTLGLAACAGMGSRISTRASVNRTAYLRSYGGSHWGIAKIRLTSVKLQVTPNICSEDTTSPANNRPTPGSVLAHET